MTNTKFNLQLELKIDGDLIPIKATIQKTDDQFDVEVNFDPEKYDVRVFKVLTKEISFKVDAWVEAVKRVNGGLT